MPQNTPAPTMDGRLCLDHPTVAVVHRVRKNKRKIPNSLLIGVYALSPVSDIFFLSLRGVRPTLSNKEERRTPRTYPVRKKKQAFRLFLFIGNLSKKKHEKGRGQKDPADSQD